MFILYLAIAVIVAFIGYRVLECIKTVIYGEIERLMNHIDIKRDRDIKFNTDPRKLYLDIYNRGNLALGEAYMLGLWETPDLYAFITKIAKSSRHHKYGKNILRKIMNPFIINQTSSIDMINRHYNLSNDFFATWLDKNMQYSCAYFSSPEMSLEDAQIAKMNLIGRKLKLQPGMTVLDIGCGWGMLAQYLAREFGVSVTGINLSKEHIKFAQERLADNPELPVEYILGDFAEISKFGIQFDRIVSVGAYEHFNGRYDDFYDTVYTNLKPDGIALLHTIGSNNTSRGTDDWILKYIFTRGRIPHISDITTYAQSHGFVVEDMHNFGMDYGRTLSAWLERFEVSKSVMKEDPYFYRMWKYYLTICAVYFNEQNLHLWQFILTKKGSRVRYTGER